MFIVIVCIECRKSSFFAHCASTRHYIEIVSLKCFCAFRCFFVHSVFLMILLPLSGSVCVVPFYLRCINCNLYIKSLYRISCLNRRQKARAIDGWRTLLFSFDIVASAVAVVVSLLLFHQICFFFHFVFGFLHDPIIFVSCFFFSISYMIFNQYNMCILAGGSFRVFIESTKSKAIKNFSKN